MGLQGLLLQMNRFGSDMTATALLDWPEVAVVIQAINA